MSPLWAATARRFDGSTVVVVVVVEDAATIIGWPRILAIIWKRIAALLRLREEDEGQCSEDGGDEEMVMAVEPGVDSMLLLSTSLLSDGSGSLLLLDQGVEVESAGSGTRTGSTGFFILVFLFLVFLLCFCFVFCCFFVSTLGLFPPARPPLLFWFWFVLPRRGAGFFFVGANHNH